MTDTEIVKTLECCSTTVKSGTCPECPYDGCEETTCVTALCTDALDLINRQKAEIERLVEHTKEGIELAKQLPETIKLAQAKAIKEFAERLKEKAHTTPVFDSYCSKTYMGNVLKVYVADIDNLVKEMVGETNAE